MDQDTLPRDEGASPTMFDDVEIKHSDQEANSGNQDPDSDLLAQSSDLDQPECEQQQQQHHSHHPSTMEEIVTTTNGSGNGLMSSSDGGSEFYIQITVSEPQKVGDGMGSYLAYRVTTTTNMTTFKKRDFYVLRRFSDFLGLHDLLVRDYLRYGRIIPPAPQKNIIGTTKVKMGNATGNQQSPTDSMTASTIAGGGAGGGLEWVENRRAALERFLNRTAQHPVLRQDVSFVNFLESEQDLPRAVNTSSLSGAGVLRMFNKVGETMNKITYKMDENDPWFEEKILEVDQLDHNMQRLHQAIKALVAHRRELAQLTGGVAKSAAMLSTCEEHTGLSRALSQLADVEEKVELLRSEQANSDLYILSETVKDYIGLFGAIKDVFHERVKVFQHWQHAQLQLTKKREFKTKLELAYRVDKMEQATQDVQIWERKVQECQRDFETISGEIKKEMGRFEITRARDFKATIVKYLEDQMAHQQQLIKFWEAFVPAAKEIQ